MKKNIAKIVCKVFHYHFLQPNLFSAKKKKYKDEKLLSPQKYAPLLSCGGETKGYCNDLVTGFVTG